MSVPRFVIRCGVAKEAEIHHGTFAKDDMSTRLRVVPLWRTSDHKLAALLYLPEHQRVTSEDFDAVARALGVS